jgi:hypothetical protein
MYFYKPLIIVALLSINVFAIDELDVGKELDKRFAVGGSMEGFRQGNKDKIRRLYRSLDPEVKTLLLRAFDHGAHMEGFFEWDKISVYENKTKIPKNAIFQAFEMFDREGCLHTAFKSTKLNLLSCLVSIQTEKLSVSFLGMLRKAIAEGALLAEVGKFSDILSRTIKEGVTRAEIGKFVKSMKRLKRSKKASKQAPLTLMDIMCDTVFARTTKPRQDFLRWFCLDNAVKERVGTVNKLTK